MRSPFHQDKLQAQVSHSWYLYSESSVCAKTFPATSQPEILDIADDPGYTTLQVSYIPTHWRCLLVGEILTMISKTIAHCGLCDEEPNFMWRPGSSPSFPGTESTP